VPPHGEVIFLQALCAGESYSAHEHRDWRSAVGFVGIERVTN
jgi:hypothetical protein